MFYPWALRIALPLILTSVALPASLSSAYIRVNQLGYAPHSQARAYLMTSVPIRSTPFRVVDTAGRTVSTGNSSTPGKRWGRFQVYSLDFSVSEAGSYTIRVSQGTLSAESPLFRVDDAAQRYTIGLRNALEFYENERDGNHYLPSALRTDPSHLHDENAKVYLTPNIDQNDTLVGDLTPTGGTINAAGGWWDAGDYLKFVQTHSYTVALMLTGVRDFPLQMGAASASSDFTAEARFGLNWLLKMWDDQSQTLYYQVGIGTGNNNIVSDHDIWRLPQEDDSYGGADPAFRYIRRRPVFVAGAARSKISPNLAGRLTAAFALGYQVFRDSDPQFAFSCLLAAEHVFALADRTPTGNLLTTAPFDFYPEAEWRDDLELGATELYYALSKGQPAGPVAKLPHTDSAFYLRAAGHWAKAYITGPNDAADSLNLYDVSGLAHFELYRAMERNSSPQLEVSREELLGDIKKQLIAATTVAGQDPFGFGFVWGSYDTATHGAGLSVMAKEYAFLTGSATFENYSRHWAGNILGANAWGASFIVGDGSTFPDCMQHQVANIIGSLDGANPRLNGALVEGPNSEGATGFVDGMRPCPARNYDKYGVFNGNGAVFIDNVQSYPTVEPAIDLTASSFLMFSWQIAGAPEP